MTQELNEKEYRELVEKINFYQKAFEETEEQILRIQTLKEQLKEFEELQGNETILAPLSDGIFIESKLSSKTLKVNVGKGIILDKTIQETITLMEEQETQIVKNHQILKNKLEEIYSNIN